MTATSTTVPTTAAATSAPAAVRVRDLTKRFTPTGVPVLDGIDLTIEEGDVVALLGPNGAGKTTTVEILEGYRAPDAGTVSVLGHDPQTGGRAFRERIGIETLSVHGQRRDLGPEARQHLQRAVVGRGLHEHPARSGVE